MRVSWDNIVRRLTSGRTKQKCDINKKRRKVDENGFEPAVAVIYKRIYSSQTKLKMFYIEN